MTHVDLGWGLFTHNPERQGQALLLPLDSPQLIKTHHSHRELATVTAPALGV